MNTREIREQLGRVKTYYLRNENLRALAAVISALSGLGNTTPSMDLRGPLREAISLVTRDAQIKSLLKTPIIYQAGQEKAILSQLAPIYKVLQEAEGFESREAALKRKIQLDQAYNLALHHLEQKRISEADAAFTQALAFYKDEHHIFCMIAKALLGADEIRRAYPYAKRGVECQPENEDALELFKEIHRLREQL